MLTVSKFVRFAELQVGSAMRTQERDGGLQPRDSEASRSSRSSDMFTKSSFGGFTEFQVGHSARARERDGGAPAPIERLVYIYVYPSVLTPGQLSDLQTCYANGAELDS